MFDGLGLYPVARTYQLIDIADPILLQILNKAELREDVDSVSHLTPELHSLTHVGRVWLVSADHLACAYTDHAS